MLLIKIIFMLLGSLGANLSGDMLAGKGTLATSHGQAFIRTLII